MFHWECCSPGNLRGGAGANRSRENLPASQGAQGPVTPLETASEAGEIQTQDRKNLNSASTTNSLSPRPSTSRAADLAGLGAVGGVGAGVAVGAEAFDLLDDGGMPLQV